MEAVAEGFVFFFFVFYANLKKKICISIECVQIKKMTNPSATTSKIVQFIINSYEMKIKDLKECQSSPKDFSGGAGMLLQGKRRAPLVS